MGVRTGTHHTSAAIRVPAPDAGLVADRTDPQGTEGTPYEDLVVTRGGRRLLRLVERGSRVSTIEVLDRSVPGPHGIHLGMTLAETRERAGELRCARGFDATWVVASCAAAGEPTVQYDFSLEGIATAGCEVDGCALGPSHLAAIAQHPLSTIRVSEPHHP